jgi:hypothetical protein
MIQGVSYDEDALGELEVLVLNGEVTVYWDKTIYAGRERGEYF